MKKIITLVVGLLMLAGVAQAAAPKAGILYELADNSPLEIVGVAVVKDVKGIKNLDVDAFIGNDLGQIQNNDNVTVLTGVSYNYDINDKFAVGIGAAVGQKRVENLKDFGETKYGIYVIASVKF